jgi:hypothetical protein
MPQPSHGWGFPLIIRRRQRGASVTAYANDPLHIPISRYLFPRLDIPIQCAKHLSEPVMYHVVHASASHRLRSHHVLNTCFLPRRWTAMYPSIAISRAASGGIRVRQSPWLGIRINLVSALQAVIGFQVITQQITTSQVKASLKGTNQSGYYRACRNPYLHSISSMRHDSHTLSTSI